MALITGQAGTADSIDAEYYTRDDPDSPVLVQMHLDAVDGIARDTVEAFAALPRRGAEVGGLLLGHVRPGERLTIWIERYQRIECAHHFGPQFVLDEPEHRGLEEAASSIARDGELDVVGFYRSHTRPGFQLEDSDLEMVGRYFNDPADLILLIRPEKFSTPAGRFYVHGSGSDIQPAGDSFAFRGRLHAVRSTQPEEESDEIQADTARTARPEKKPQSSAYDDNPDDHPEKQRRIVPDFDVTPPSLPEPLKILAPEPESASDNPDTWRKWRPFLAAMLVVGCAVGFLFLLWQAGGRRETVSTKAPVVALPVRPLGLYVDPAGQNWRVSWNSSATALQGARGVQLFARDGDDQSRIDLAPQDLQSGTYLYQPRDEPKGSDVTFRLEVTEAGGQISAESFRFVKSAPTAAPEPPTAAAPPGRRPARPMCRARLIEYHRWFPRVFDRAFMDLFLSTCGSWSMRGDE